NGSETPIVIKYCCRRLQPFQWHRYIYVAVNMHLMVERASTLWASNHAHCMPITITRSWACLSKILYH
ncbi:hypothetical protein NDU88_002608, partial [Pleurodeles waltl]